MKIDEAVKLFMTAKEGVVSNQTFSWYRSLLKRLVEFVGGDKRIRELTVHNLREWRAAVAREGMSDTTVHSCCRVAKQLFKWLEVEGIGANIAARLENKKPKIKARPGVAFDDMRRMLDAVRDLPRDYAILRFFADTGCRLGGVANLKIDDLDLEHGQAVVTEKGNKTRAVFFTPETSEALSAYLDVRPVSECPFVFVSYRGKIGALKHTGIKRVFNRAAQLAGVKENFSPHQFRHGAARGMLGNGANLAQVAQILGHEDVRVTVKFYGAFATRELKEAHSRYGWMKDFPHQSCGAKGRGFESL